MLVLAGVDEVGRGSLAGDMYIGVCLIKENSSLFPVFSKPKTCGKLNLLLDKERKVYIRDSKKLSQKQRERAVLFLKNKVSYGVVKVPIHKIEQEGLSNSFRHGVKAIFEWIKTHSQPTKTKVFVDGIITLDCKIKFSSIQFVKHADDTIPIVATASIFAKVARDAYMRKLHSKFPVYNWQQNVGYGTKQHIKAVKKYGITKYHRRSFLKRILSLH